MLSVEDQLERVATAAFDQTTPVTWGRPDTTGPSPRRPRRGWILAAAAATVAVVVGGLVAVVRSEESPTEPVTTTATLTQASVPASVPATTPATEVTRPSPPTVTSFLPTPTVSIPLELGDGTPLVAVTAHGDAVVFDRDTRPVVVYDADGSAPIPGEQPADRPEQVAITSDGTAAFIGLCCDTSGGTIVATHLPTGNGESFPGRTPTLNLTSTHLAYQLDGAVAVRSLTTERVDTIEIRYGVTDFDVEVHDFVWIGDGQLLVLGQVPNAWTRTVVNVTDDALEPETTFPFAMTREFPELRFAGTAVEGEIAVHDVGTDRILSAPLDDYGNINGGGRGSSLSVLQLPAPAQSAWYTTPDSLTWIDNKNTLRSQTVTFDSAYSWARR